MRVLSTSLLVVLFCVCIFAQPFNQKVPFEVCDLVYDTASCFQANDTTAIKVGEHVTKLDEKFRFCLSDEIFSGAPPIKVIIAIDRSGSMGSNDPNNMRTEAAHAFVENLRKMSPTSYVGSLVFSDNVSGKSVYGPIKLGNQAEYDTLWDRIESGSRAPQYRLAKTLATNQGIAFTAALDMMVNINKTVPGMKQHIIMITDDGWFEINDVSPDQLLSKFRPQFPANLFPKIHPVVLTGSGNPKGERVQGLANIQMIADKTNGLYIENATPVTIVAKLSEILETMTPRMDKLIGVTMKNVTTGESHKMSLESNVSGANDYIISGTAWDLVIGENVFAFEKTILMRDSTTDIVYDTMRLSRSHETITTILSINSSTNCNIEWPNASFTAIPESLVVNEVINSKIQIDPSFKFPYELHDVSIKGFTTSNSGEASILSLFRLDSNVTNARGTGNSGDGTPTFNKHVGAFGGSMTDGSFTTSVPFPTGEFSFDFWVKSDGKSTKTLLSSKDFSLSMNQDGVVTFLSGSENLKSTINVYSGVWTNIAVARRDGIISIFINGIDASKARALAISGDQTVTVSAGSGFIIDEIRFNSVSNVNTTIFGHIYSVAQVSGTNWTLGGTSVTTDAVNIPPSTWDNNAVSFSITRSSAAQVILNMTRLDDIQSWAINSNPIEFVSPFPPPVPVEVVLMDKNGNGFIDHITFTVQDTSILAASLPSAGDYLKTLTITTYDDKTVSLIAESIERNNDKTFTIKLTENSGTSFETGWKSEEFSTKDVSVVTSGAYTEIIRIVDKAGPVISKVIINAGSGEGTKRIDTLTVSFSEPLKWLQTSTIPQDAFNYYNFATKTLEALNGIKNSDMKIADDGRSVQIMMTNDYVVQPLEDSLQLKSVIERVTDQSENAAHASGRIAPIEGTTRLKYTDVTLILNDENGNGFIDIIEVHLPENIAIATQVPDADKFFTKHSLETYMGSVSLNVAGLTIVNEHLVKISLRENTGSKFETGWTNSSFEIVSSPLTTDRRGLRVAEVIDNAGPVIARSRFEYGEEGKKNDVLKIQFSEPVYLEREGISVPADIFNYYQRKNLAPAAFESIPVSSFTLNSGGLDADVIMTNGFFVLPVYDSLQLKNVSEHIVDNKGNSAHDKSRIAVIDGKARLLITLVPSANPYVPGTEIPQNIREYYSEVLKHSDKNVVLVAIKSTLPLTILPNGSYGEVVIYDALGNVVQRDLQVYVGALITDYGFTWNATNLNGRKVNQGIYLAIIKVNDFYGTEHVFRQKLGIK